jgi:MYXO-CTERM domain-containing protein
MRDIKSVLACSCLVPAALIGCGSVDKKMGSPIETAPTEIAQTVCPKAYDCCTAAQLMGNDMAGTDEASCEMKTTDAFTQQLANVQASEKAGRAMYDGEKVEACLATIRSSTCQMLQTTNHLAGVPGCDTFAKPLVAAGGECFNTFECIQGWCKPNQSMSGGAGSCVVPQDGDACGAVDPKCAPGFNCDSNTGKCVKAQADNSPCTSGLQCESGVCSSSTPGGTCVPRGATCFYASGCSVAGGGCAPLPALLALAILAGLAARRHRHRRRQ